jgi:hypothetical protein
MEEVFDFIIDFERAPEWQGELVGVKDVSARPLGPGESMTVVLEFMGRHVENVMQVSSFERPIRFSLTTVSGYLPVDLDFLLEPAAGGTRVTYMGDWELPSGFLFRLFRLAKPIFDRMDRQQWQSNLETLKILLEQDIHR